MFERVGVNSYFILMGINLLGLIVVVLFWPETKGISLEHMDRIFGEVDKVEAYRKEVEIDPRAIATGQGQEQAQRQEEEAGA